jgi:hypothetical protein
MIEGDYVRVDNQAVEGMVELAAEKLETDDESLAADALFWHGLKEVIGNEEFVGRAAPYLPDDARDEIFSDD